VAYGILNLKPNGISDEISLKKYFKTAKAYLGIYFIGLSVVIILLPKKDNGIIDFCV